MICSHKSGLSYNLYQVVALAYTVNMFLKGYPLEAKTAPKNSLKRPLKKKTKIGFQDRLSLNAG